MNQTFPLRMVRGNAGTPQRFWDRRVVFNDQEKAQSVKEGFVVSSDQSDLTKA